MPVQVKLAVGSVATHNTHKFWKNDINSFLMHSFLVSCQIAFRCRMINACINLKSQEKTWVFSMCVANADCQMLFASEYFVTEIARRFNLLMDSPVVVTQSFFGHELFATHVADIITHHFHEICGI